MQLKKIISKMWYDAYWIRSTWSCYWLDQFLRVALNTLILSIFYISLDLSIIYFAHFSSCWASFVCSCHSITECCGMFSGVKLSMGSFVLSPAVIVIMALKNQLFWRYGQSLKANISAIRGVKLWKNYFCTTASCILFRWFEKMLIKQT